MYSTEATILIIEDMQDTRNVMGTLLQDIAKVVLAASGEDAVQLAKEENFAVIIVDVCLGTGIDGFETIRRIRNSGGIGNYAPVIFITGYDNPISAATAIYQLAAVDYLIKPVDPVFMRERVRWFTDLYNRAHRYHTDAQHELTDFLENAIVPLHWIGPSGVIIWANRAELELFGYSDSEYIGHHISEFYGVEAASSFMNKLCGHERLISYEVSVKCKDNTVKTVEISSNVFWRDNVFVHTRCFTRDVTRNREVEVALRESERRFRCLADSIPQVVWLADGNGTVIYFNRRWYAYTGITEQSSSFAGAIHPDERTAVLTIWAQCVQNNEPFSGEARIRRADGQYRRNLLLGVPIPDDSGIAQWFGTGTDIEDQKLTEDMLRRSNAELEQFAYVASHDLQEPLRMITTYLQLLQELWHDQLDAKSRQYIGFVIDGAIRMQALIHDLLQFSRIGTRGLQLKDIPAHRPYDQALANLRTAIEDAGAIVTRGELPTIRADESQIAQLFQNLIGNAIKFRRDVPLHIHVDAEFLEPDRLCFTVADNGIGIAKKHFEQIFIIFRRLHHRQQYPGTGIGLAICKRIVERHGGRIWVDSEVGQGTIIYFTIAAPTEPIPKVRGPNDGNSGESTDG